MAIPLLALIYSLLYLRVILGLNFETILDLTLGYTMDIGHLWRLEFLKYPVTQPIADVVGILRGPL